MFTVTGKTLNRLQKELTIGLGYESLYQRIRLLICLQREVQTAQHALKGREMHGSLAVLG